MKNFIEIEYLLTTKIGEITTEDLTHPEKATCILNINAITRLHEYEKHGVIIICQDMTIFLEIPQYKRVLDFIKDQTLFINSMKKL